MASNLYRILEASEVASQETLQTLFEKKNERLEQELVDGSSTAKEQLWVLRQAYQTLSNPAKRAAYDDSVKSKIVQGSSTRTVMAQPDGLSWKTNTLLIAMLVSGLVGLGLHLGRSAKNDENTTQILQINRTSDNDATRASTERILVEGVTNNHSRIIDRSAELGNRSVNMQQDAENRRRQELEFRANAAAKILDMQKEREDRQFAMQEQRSQEARRQAEERKVANEKRYWACMNSALDRVSAADAGARCAGYR